MITLIEHFNMMLAHTTMHKSYLEAVLVPLIYNKKCFAVNFEEELLLFFFFRYVSALQFRCIKIPWNIDSAAKHT